jgi:HEPN domain-containing protein
MHADSLRRLDAASWMRKSSDDLRCARIDLAAEPPAVGDALFHCQQAAEKALKSLLVWHDEPFQRTHDLGKLGAQVVALDFSVTPYVERIVELTKYAWVFRYPGDPQDPSPEEALLALSVVQDLVEVILGRLPDDARP